MTTRWTVGPPAGDAELAAYGEALRHAFHMTDAAITRQWFERAGHEHIRLARDGGTVAGGLLLVQMGQWFGGRSVPMTGVAAVAVLPEHRSRGAATALMRAAVAEMAAAGVPISSLFPATLPLYRRVGYEIAGTEYMVSLPTSAMQGGDRALTLRAAADGDRAAIEDAYTRRARLGNGNLDRCPRIWQRVRDRLGEKAAGYVVEGANGLEGYAYVVANESAGQTLKLWCNDLVALTPAAARRFVAFFADHRSTVQEAGWRGSLSDPVLAALHDPWDVNVKTSVWMLRVLDVAAALSARGYAPGLAAEVHIEVAADDLLPQNSGRFVLRVADGRGIVERGGRGALRTTVRGLASLFTGFQSSAELRASGLADGDDATLASASAVFAGPHPSMADHF